MSTSDVYDDSETASEPEERFQGSIEQWKRHTADERELAASREQLEATDLSIHLFNAHAVKASQYDRKAIQQAKPWQGRERWYNRDDSQWRPGPEWAAWPSSAADVPRPNETSEAIEYAQEHDEATYHKQETWRPSRDLEDEMLAMILNIAKGRERQDASTQHSSLPAHTTPRDGARAIPSAIAELESDQPRSSDSTASPHSSPHITIDEDEARRVLLPSIRQTMTNLDSLFAALHRSRMAYKISHRGRKSSVAQGHRSLSTSSEAISADATDSNDSSSIDEEERGKQAQTVEYTRTPYPRDWSEVLGLAAMIGWDKDIIHNASSRCASLFGENMRFIEMPDVSEPSRVDNALEHAPSRPSLTRKQSADDKMPHAPFYCPIDTCRRAERAFSSVRRINEHLRRNHDWTNTRCSEWHVERRRQLAQTADRCNSRDTSAYRHDDAFDALLQPVKLDHQALQARRKHFARDTR